MKKFIASVSWKSDSKGWMREYMREYRKDSIKRRKHLDRLYPRRKLLRSQKRFLVLAHYSKGIPKCECCGEIEISFLAIDHIEGNGGTQRKELGVHSMEPNWFIKNGFPKGFQILCHNCNWGKYKYGECPHLSKVKG